MYYDDRDLEAPWVGKCRDDYYDDFDDEDEEKELEFDEDFEYESRRDMRFEDELH